MFIDTHCDTAYVILDENKSLNSNNLHIDLDRMGKDYTQFFAAYIDKDYYSAPFMRACSIIEKIKAEISENSDKIEFCTNNLQRQSALARGHNCAFLSLEGGEAFEDIASVSKLYELGVRLSTLTWNYTNRLAGGADENGGLSDYGRKVIAEMNKLGMILDLSHLNEESFWQVMRTVKYPPIASHSCSKAVCSHRRNLTDAQFRAICTLGGVVGINFYPSFLSDSNTAAIDTIFEHIDHFITLGGENHIGLGSDFDGVDSLPEGITGIESMPLLAEKLTARYGRSIADKICYGNFERILRLL